MRLIDADALKEFIGTYDGTTAQVEAVEVQYIDNAPTIDDLSAYSDKLWKQAYERGKAEARLQGEWIPVKDLNNFIRTCREELFEKMKDYHPREFEIRENMLLNFEQIVKLASSKYEADMRGGRE